MELPCLFDFLPHHVVSIFVDAAPLLFFCNKPGLKGSEMLESEIFNLLYYYKKKRKLTNWRAGCAGWPGMARAAAVACVDYPNPAA